MMSHTYHSCGLRMDPSFLHGALHFHTADSPNGVYAPGCGLEALRFAWGHDEYMYRLLTHPKNAAACARIPAEGLAMVRYHSCYCWHTSGAYAALASGAGDAAKKAWVLR